VLPGPAAVATPHVTLSTHETKHELPAWEKVLVKVFGEHKRCYDTRRLRVALRKGYYVSR
jgi:predicted FMN-binding regulatory protein PaiB